jgi:hypothetical protein
MDEKTTDFCKLILHPAALLNVFMMFMSFFGGVF